MLTILWGGYGRYDGIRKVKAMRKQVSEYTNSDQPGVKWSLSLQKYAQKTEILSSIRALPLYCFAIISAIPTFIEIKGNFLLQKFVIKCHFYYYIHLHISLSASVIIRQNYKLFFAREVNLHICKLRALVLISSHCLMNWSIKQFWQN